MPELPYGPRKASRTATYRVRGLAYTVRLWGPEGAPTVVLLHGIRDASATFQFLVDCMARTARYIAPDWRGHGGSASTGSSDWFHEYLADLDALLETLAPDAPVDLVGHSLGGNVASVYAGLRPERVRRLVSLDAFGTLPVGPAEWPDVLSRWLRQLRVRPPSRRYDSLAAIAARLTAANHRLPADKALFLAEQLARRLPDGGYVWRHDAISRRSTPTLRSLDEWIACWRAIACPALWVGASDPRPNTVRSNPDAFARMTDEIGRDSVIVLIDTGHNLHHDAPERLAPILDAFLGDAGSTLAPHPVQSLVPLT